MDRLIRRSLTTKTHPLLNCCLYYLQWYKYEPADPSNALPPVEYDPNNAGELRPDLCPEDTDDDEYDKYWELFQHGMNVIRKDDADKFLCWALFGKHRHELEDWEEAELQKAHEKGEDTFGFCTKSGSAGVYFPKVLLSLENCISYHRPLMFYAAVEVFRQCGYLAFKLMGFKLHVTKTGVRCWYKRGDKNCDLLPILLFQGIAPGGPVYYLPFISTTLARDGRSVYLFECEAVSCTMRFNTVISEEDTISGIREVVDKFENDRDLCILGHSFGSCQLTWMIHSPLRNRIKQFIALEPASLMLSESDVILNMHTPHLRLCVDLVMEWYIRRKFEWYNSELWLDDIPQDCRVIIGVAGQDIILNSSKIREEVESYSTLDKRFAERTKLLYSKYGTHGNCLVNPYAWRDIREAMLQQQLSLYKGEHFKKKMEESKPSLKQI